MTLITPGAVINRWFLDPLSGWGFAEDMRRAYDDDLQVNQPGDLETIATPIDFLALNCYFRNIARAAIIREADNAPRTVDPNDEVTEMGWAVYPRGMYEILGLLHFGYGFPGYYITENGAAVCDQVGPDGQVGDPAGVSYFRHPLQQVLEAIAIGVPVRGYFVWPLLNNFEWAYGTSQRFGLIHLDYRIQQRTPKASAKWYQQVIGENALV